MTPSLDGDLLRAFVTVADTGSVTRAARFLHLTQSAASLQIRRLEEQLEASLFHRTTRGVTLTPAGEAFLVSARRLLQLQEEAVASVRRRERGPVDVRVGLPDVYAVRYLPPVLATFRKRFPEVRPVVKGDVSTRVVQAFEAGELDVCLDIRHDPDSRGRVLGEEELCWVASPRLELDAEAPLPLALYPDYCIFRAHALRALAEAHRPWEISYTSESSAAIDIAVDEALAVAIKARSTVRSGWRVLGAAEGFPPIEPVQVELHRSPDRSAEAVRLFADLLADAVREDLAGT